MKKSEFLAQQAAWSSQKTALQTERANLLAQRDYAKARKWPHYQVRSRLQQIEWELEDLEKKLMIKWSDNASCNVRRMSGYGFSGRSTALHSSRYLDTPDAHKRPLQGGLCSPR